MRKSVKINQAKSVKINFVPITDEEKAHKNKLEGLLAEKRHGDWPIVAQMIGLNPQNAEKAFLRVYSKSHFEAVAALETVINNRKTLLNQ